MNIADKPGSAPMHEHDSDCCRFVCTFDDIIYDAVDLYICGDPTKMYGMTLSARRSSDPPDYSSMDPVYMHRAMKEEPDRTSTLLQRAYRKWIEEEPERAALYAKTHNYEMS